MNEMIITFDLHPNDRNVFNHNNIYLSFWAWTKKIRLWDDIPLTSINNICQILEKFLRYPEIEIISIYKESFFNTSALPLQIINSIENLNKRKYVLKFDKIIEPNINFEEQRYIDLLNEINGCYRYGFFTAMYVLIRKLLENLILDCLRNYYDTNDIKKYYDEDKRKHQNFNTLKLNFNEMINESEFIRKAGNVEQKYIDLLNDFKETGNIHSHSLLSLLHQSAIEDKKEIINIFIQRIKEIRNLL